MAKDCFYFSHDSNAKDDPKIVMMIEQMGLEGFGIYWVLIEILRDQPTYKYPLSLIPAMARRYNTTAEKMKIVVSGYGLFEIDEDVFFSISLMNRMGKMDAMRQQRIEAGKKSAEKRLLLNEKPTTVERPLNEKATSVQQLKESKVKESKVKEKKRKEIKNTYSEFVTMTTDEYDRLVNEFGQDAVIRMIEILNNYKGANGKKYDSDNLAIRNWVAKRYQEEQNQTVLFSNKPKMNKREQQLDEVGRMFEEYDRINSQQNNNGVCRQLPQSW